MRYEMQVGGRVRRVEVTREAGRFAVTVDGRRSVVDAVRVDPHTVSLLIEDGERTYSREVGIHRDAGALHLGVGAAVVPIAPNGFRSPQRQEGAGADRVVAPMPGKVVRLLVETGARVAPRQAVIVIEAMKMENALQAGTGGVVAEIAVQVGQSVEAGTLLLRLAAGPPS